MIIITDAEANMIDRTDMKLKPVNVVSCDVIIGVLLSDIVDITVTVLINVDKQDVTCSVVELNSFIYEVDDNFLKVEVLSCDMIDVEVISCDVTDVEVISCDVTDVELISCDVTDVEVISCDVTGVEVISCDVTDVEVISCDVTDVEVISSSDVEVIFSEESIVISRDKLFSLMMMLTSLNSLLSIAVIIVPGLICLPSGRICDTSKYISLCVT